MIRRRNAFVLLTLAALLALAVVFRGRWLPGLLSGLTDNAALIATLNNAAGVIGTLAAVVAALAAVLALRRPAVPRVDTLALVQPVTLEALQATFRDVKGQSFQYIDRGATRPTALLAARRVVIVGPQKVGKSREAVELIGRSLEYCHIPPARIFRPTNNLRALPPDAVASQIAKDVTTDDALLLFIDDLPYAFRGDEFEQLSAALRALERGQALYVVATAREDQLDERGRAWLAAQRFEMVSLGRWSKEQIGPLVDDGIYLIETSVDAGGRTALIEGNDGTTEIARLTLLGVADKGQGDQETVESIQKDTLALTWQARRRALIEEQPAITPLLRAAAVFHMARVTPYCDLIMALAAQNAKGTRTARSLLAARDKLVAGEVLLEEEQWLQLQDYAIEGEGIDQMKARREVGAFLMSYRRWFRYPGLHWFYLSRLAHADALFELALVLDEATDGEAILNYITAAIGLRPYFGHFIIRGNLYEKLNQPQNALADYNKAIRLNPTYSSAFFFRGKLLAHKGNNDGALADIGEAIRLDPSDALNWGFRGMLYYDQGFVDEALDDLSTAIRLEPDNARLYATRGIVYLSQNLQDKALADLSAAIHRNSTKGLVFLLRGDILLRAGLQDEALIDYNQALYLDPANVSALIRRGLLYNEQGLLEEALADYSQAILQDTTNDISYAYRGHLLRRMNKVHEAVHDFEHLAKLGNDSPGLHAHLAGCYFELGRDEDSTRHLSLARDGVPETNTYDRAYVEALAGNNHQALDLLERAIEEGKVDRKRIRQDLDWQLLRDDPRFRRLLGDEV